MRVVPLIFVPLFIMSCLSTISKRASQPHTSNSINIIDTFYLDTLLLYTTIEPIATKPFFIVTNADQIIFKHCIFNHTSDTLEIMAKTSAGWVAPSFPKNILPKSYDYISYQYLVTNHKGIVNTGIYINYKTKGADDKDAKYLTIRLTGKIE